MSPQVIVINGGSSSGKSEIVRRLQAVLPDPWLRMGVDDLIDALPPMLKDKDADTGVRFGGEGQVEVGAGFRAAEAAWTTGIAAMARAGAHVIIDDVFLGGAVSQERTRALLGDLDVVWIGVRCDAAIAAAREAARGDRVPGMAASQADLVHVGVRYDIEVDTGHSPAIDCARVIAAHLRARP